MRVTGARCRLLGLVVHARRRQARHVVRCRDRHVDQQPSPWAGAATAPSCSSTRARRRCPRRCLEERSEQARRLRPREAEVNGVIVDVASDDRVKALKTQADSQRRMSVREEPGGLRDQEHRRRLSGEQAAAELRRDRRQRRRHSVLPLSRPDPARPGIRLRAAGQQQFRFGGEPARQLRARSGRLRREATLSLRASEFPDPRARRRPTGRDACGDRRHDRRLRGRERHDRSDVVARDRLRLPAGRRGRRFAWSSRPGRSPLRIR